MHFVFDAVVVVDSSGRLLGLVILGLDFFQLINVDYNCSDVCSRKRNSRILL